MADIVFSTLVDVDRDEVTILPDLATEWTVSPDATVYTFKLNPAAVWSDGKPVTADDVEWTIAWAAQNADGVEGRDPDRDVVQRQGWRGGVRARRTSPKASRRSTTNTVEITLEGARLRRSCAASPARSTTSSPKHILDGPDRRGGADLRVLPRHRRRDDRLRPVRLHRASISATGATFTAKKNYWKGKDVPIDQIVYKIQESNVSVAPAGRR